jgi:hypothetical protein
MTGMNAGAFFTLRGGTTVPGFPEMPRMQRLFYNRPLMPDILDDQWR